MSSSRVNDAHLPPLLLAALVTMLPLSATAQTPAKKPLGHEVYDSWMRVTGELVSADARWVLYSLEPGEGDARLIIYHALTGKGDTIARGVNAKISEDSDYAAFAIKPLFADIRRARNAKKRPDDMPKDSLGILRLGTSDPVKIPRVKSFKLPTKGSGWIAYQLEKESVPPDTSKKKPADSDAPDAATKDTQEEKGTTVVFRELATGAQYLFRGGKDYLLTRDGTRLLVTCAGDDSGAAPGVFVFSTLSRTVDTIAIGKGAYREPTWDDAGTQAAFVADRDTSKSKQRRFSLYYWKAGSDSALLLVDTLGMYPHWQVSEHGRLFFSKDGTKLFFGTAPVPMPDDTTLIEEETPKLDIWNWQDPLLQSQQVKNLDDEKKRSYTAVVHLADRKFVQLGDTLLPTVATGDEGNAPVALGLSDLPYRRERSWEASPSVDAFAVDLRTGARTRLLTYHKGSVSLSPAGRYLTWFDGQKRHWFAMPIGGGRAVNLTATVSVPLYNELNDVPDDPGPYGSAGWTEQDSLFMVYDRHDIWVTDPTGAREAWCMTKGEGRRGGDLRYRYVALDPEERFLKQGSSMLLRLFRYRDKSAGFALTHVVKAEAPRLLIITPHDYGVPVKAENRDSVIFLRSSFVECPDLYRSGLDFAAPVRVSDANPQQKEYRWGTVELFSWKGGDRQPLDGLLYKPEGFDPKKKYPMIVYFYERNSDLLHRYFLPAPSASSVNVALYVSRGYIIFIPDIRYKIGYPGRSAFDCVVPGVRALIARGFIDKDRIGLQGQSWGGYQTAFIVTRTRMFRGAMAGAAVANMTSAYGGIRWESGVVREFQYEHTQSRIGATLWERPDLYIENSPLFRADSIRTPLLMMNNDADGAVPWHQGIELFTALRRLGRPAWMLTYNAEAHNLVQRKNRKDFSIRMLQFFDHYLMDQPAPRWMTEGLPAIEKGKTLRYELSRPEDKGD